MLIKQYWASIWIATYQVFMGVFVGTMFVSSISQEKVVALFSSATFAIMSWYLGFKATYE